MSSEALFITYHHADLEVVQRLGHALAERGIRVCLSNGTNAAMPIETPAVAVCLGPQGLDQRQKREVGWALAWQAQEEQQGRAFPTTWPIR
jgi:hypothetical protein